MVVMLLLHYEADKDTVSFAFSIDVLVLTLLILRILGHLCRFLQDLRRIDIECCDG